MEFLQEQYSFGKAKRKLVLKDTGFQFFSEEKLMGKETEKQEHFFSYSEITNRTKKKIGGKAPGEFHMGYRVYLLILIAIAFFRYSIHFGDDSSVDSLLTIFFLILCPIIIVLFFVYKRLTVAGQRRVVVELANGGYFTLLDDEHIPDIMNELYKRRNVYMREKYIGDNEVSKTLSPEAIEYLESLGVITNEEAMDFKEKNKSHLKSKVGFETGEDTLK